jgi:hypothetical protein
MFRFDSKAAMVSGAVCGSSPALACYDAHGALNDFHDACPAPHPNSSCQATRRTPTLPLQT